MQKIVLAKICLVNNFKHAMKFHKQFFAHSSNIALLGVFYSRLLAVLERPRKLIQLAAKLVVKFANFQ